MQGCEAVTAYARAREPDHGRAPPLRSLCRLLQAALLWTLAGPSLAEPCHLDAAWDPYEPYSYAGVDGTPAGFDVDVLSRVAGMLGCTLSWSRMEWADVLDALEDGRVDLAVGTGYKPGRAAWSWYSESYRKEVIGLLVRRGGREDFPGESLADLLAAGLVFGKTTGDTYDAAATEVFDRYPGQVREPVDEAENLARLLEGDIDGFLIEVNVGAALARRHEAVERVERHALSFESGDYRFQASKKTVAPSRMMAINEAIQRLDAEGWLEQALASYGIRPPPQGVPDPP